MSASFQWTWLCKTGNFTAISHFCSCLSPRNWDLAGTFLPRTSRHVTCTTGSWKTPLQSWCKRQKLQLWFCNIWHVSKANEDNIIYLGVQKKLGSQTKSKQEWSCVHTEFGDQAISLTLSPFQPFRNPPLVCEFYTEETALQTKVPKVCVFILL